MSKASHYTISAQCLTFGPEARIDSYMPICPHCGQQMPPETPEWAKDEGLGEVRARINRMLLEPDPLAGLPANAKRLLSQAGMADGPEKIARALQYRLLTRQTKGIGDRTYAKIERWLEGKGLIRVSEEENFFWKKTKKVLT
jgi:hypothetical protein